MNILEVSHLTKIYGEGDNATRALDDVSFGVSEGSFSQSSDRRGREVDAAASDRRRRSSHLGNRFPQRRGRLRANRRAARDLPAKGGRADLSVLQPHPGFERNGEHHASRRPRRPQRERGAARKAHLVAGPRRTRAPSAKPALGRSAARRHRTRAHERARHRARR